MKLRILAALVALAVLATVGLAACSGQTRSTQAFCSTVEKEKAKYVSSTNVDSSSSTGDVLAGLGAVAGLPQMFNRLDKVAPDSIEPDVANIRDSLKKSEDSADGSLAGLAGGLVAGLASMQSWQNVDQFITTNCPVEQAAAVAASSSAVQQHQVANVQQAMDTALTYLTMFSDEIGYDTSQLDSDLQSVKDAYSQEKELALGPYTVAGDCEVGIVSVAQDAYQQSVANVKAVATQWPPTDGTNPDEQVTSTMLRQRITEAQAAVAAAKTAGADMTLRVGSAGTATTPDELVAAAQAQADKIDAHNAAAHDPDWYLAQMAGIGKQIAHPGGPCG